MRQLLKITVSDNNIDLAVFFIEKGNNHVQRLDEGSIFVGYGTADEIKRLIEKEPNNAG